MNIDEDKVVRPADMLALEALGECEGVLAVED
ncbi:hypothetical protein R69749_08167 [Paraburkholderia domus]|nr:hypothetical protein R69749_08167 [Paraburkholderia domus]